MIRAEIPQDVTDYKEEFFFGLTLRKLVSAIAAVAVAALAFLFGRKFLDTSIVIYAAAVACSPIILVGFKEVNGMPFEKYAKMIWDHYTKEQRRRFVYTPREVNMIKEINTVLLAGEKIFRKDEIRENKRAEKIKKKKEGKMKKNAE